MKLSFVTILLLATFHLAAQHTRIITDEQATFKKARDLYADGSYSLAYPLFKDLQNSFRTIDRSNQSILVQDVDYYAAVCGLMQNDTSAVYNAKKFIETEPNNPRTQMLSYHLANYYFKQKRFVETIPLYEAAAIENLTNAEIAKMRFNLGYAYFTQQEFVKAKPLFNAIRQIEKDENYLDANYYYGFISYYDADYMEALGALQKVENKDPYSKVVPFYITQIYYLTGSKDKAMQYAEKMLENGGGYYDLEMRQLVGHSYFEKRQFAKALPYLERYVNESKKVRREDIYELSFCYYQEKRWAKSIEGFKQLTNGDDSLSQNSMYLLGDAYLKINQKANARTAFAYCAHNSSNEIQREIAKFTYAKLSYELGYQDVAMTEIKDFLNEFPNSTYTKEAKELVVAMLSHTNNFREAQAQIESISNPSDATQRLYPRILYGRASEYINDQDWNAAEQLLDKIIASKYNESVIQATNFWKGELAYKKNDLQSTIVFLQKYLDAPVTNGEVNTTNAQYTLGYAFLRQENYNRALGFFTNASKNVLATNNTIEQDAHVRAADCYFMGRDFAKSIQMYDVAIGRDWFNADYATYQKAMATGATNNAAKIELLRTIEKRYPKSSLINDANLEIATSYMADLNFNAALPYLNTIMKTPGSESVRPKTLLNTGICYAGLNNDNEAIKAYKQLVATYPNSEEADDAIESLEKIYLEQGRAGEYAEFMRTSGKSLSVTREDSLTYIAAENAYNNNDLNAATNGFKNYLIKFPTGAFELNANYYLAEIYNSKKDQANALKYYEIVADKGVSKFAERATAQAARINYFELKNYAKAETYFTTLRNIAVNQEVKLDALRGLVRSQYYQQKYNEAGANAKELASQKSANSDDKVVSNMVLGKSAQLAANYAEAISKYKIVTSLNKAAFAAEARYEIAACHFAQNKYLDAEKAAFEVVNKSGSYELWLTKAYILLGDIYYAQKDYFNAKATYQSVYDHATIPDLKAEAKQKLDKAIEDEKANSKIETNK